MRGGRAISQSFQLPEPEDHTDDYDRILAMARMQIDDVIEVSESEFGMYVTDQWAWSAPFTTTAFRYSTDAR